jgi:prepilin-type N-terminal cleavage/methylation domain-containing protein
MKMFRKDEGFTLVELMVVVLIIGILVAIAVPIFNAAKASAQTKTCFANERTVEGAYQSYMAGDNSAATDLATLKTALVPNYVKTWPECPTAVAHAELYSSTYPVGNGSVTLTCSTHGHY